MNQPDIIFIGAGINSLGAALILAEAGWRVLVLDRNDVPGGAVRTLELTLPGFQHDIGATNLTVLANSPFFKEREDRLRRHGVEFLKADCAFGSIAADGRFLGITTNREANLRAIAEFSREDAEAWKRWAADFDRCAPFLSGVFGSPAVAAGPLQYVFGHSADVPQDAAVALRGILLDSLRENLTARFQSDVVQAMIAAWGMHLDYAPDVSGGCWMPFLETNVDERMGISIARSGSGRVIRALCDAIEEVDGEVRTSQTVDRILFENGRAVGVRLAGGETIRATRAVAASVTPPALLKLTDGMLPPAETARAQAWKFGPGTFVIHLAMSGLPDWRAGDGARRSFYIHIAPSLDYLAAAYQQAMAGLLTADPVCLVAQPTLYDPSRAPAGKHVLWITVRAVPAVIRGDVAGRIRGPNWTDDVKDAFADRVLDLIQRHAPGIRRQILDRAIHSPAELERLNPNLGQGDLNAGSMHLSQFYGQRPFFGASRTPMPGLYLCGASTWPGSGANVGSGVLLAQLLLKEAQSC